MQKDFIERIAKELDLPEKQVFECIQTQVELIKESTNQNKIIKVGRLGKFIPLAKLREHRVNNMKTNNNGE